MREASSKFSRRMMLAVPLAAIAVLAGCAVDPGAGGMKTEQPRPEPRTEPAPAPDADGEPGPGSGAAAGPMLLLASLAHAEHVAIIDPARGDAEAVRRVRVGAAPWGVGVDAARQLGYAATAEGLAVIDLAAGKRERLVRYRNPAERIGQGEYRPGGLGLAVSPDGARVYVAVTPDGSSAYLEVYDTERRRFIADVPVGARPFDVLVAPDGSWAATVDHDSFTVTVVDARTLKPRARTVAPFGTEGGLASWEKPHYGAVDADGTILLPYQGKVVARLDPRTGRFTTIRSTANSHAHGTSLAGRRLLTVGTGSFGNATGRPNLSILDVDTGKERVVPLSRPHETVAAWRDASGREFAAVAGGNTRDEGWNGITLVDLKDRSLRELAVPDYPQAVVAFASA